MTEIRFYHLQTKSLEQALPEILQKAVAGGRRVVVRLRDEKAVARLNEVLWTFNPDSFLPHGSKKDGFAAQQPVWLTDSDENPNNADTLILTQGCVADNPGAYTLCCEMLEDSDGESVAAARGRWKDYKEAGYSLAYWQQTAQGGWEQKAS